MSKAANIVEQVKEFLDDADELEEKEFWSFVQINIYCKVRLENYALDLSKMLKAYFGCILDINHYYMADLLNKNSFLIMSVWDIKGNSVCHKKLTLSDVSVKPEKSL